MHQPKYMYFSLGFHFLLAQKLPGDMFQASEGQIKSVSSISEHLLRRKVILVVVVVVEDTNTHLVQCDRLVSTMATRKDIDLVETAHLPAEVGNKNNCK